jgi:integrase
MPKVAKQLSARAVAALKHNGVGRSTKHSVGGVPGLMLITFDTGGRSWLYRGTFKKRRRDFGLGTTLDLSLAEAREKALEYRKLLRSGIDPKAREEHAVTKSISFAQAVKRFCETELLWVKEKERKAWISTMNTYAIPVLGKRDVDDISTTDVARILKPIWSEKREIAKKVRTRLDKIFVWLKATGYRTTLSPAKWEDLKPILDPLGRAKAVVHQPAIPFTQIPDWFAIVQAKRSISARALEFLCLTAVRSGDVRFLPWSEIDFERRVWTIPPNREGTKLKDRDHKVPLTDRMLSILEQMLEIQSCEYVFPGPHENAMSDNTVSKLMRDIHKAELSAGRPGFVDQQSGRRAVPHGLRSSFRDWVAECTEYPGELAEIAIAHKHGSNTELAYRRLAQVEKRRPLMVEWGDYLNSAKPLQSPNKRSH